MPRPRQPARHFPRVARVNEVVLECLAEEVEQLSDPRLGFVTITGVEMSGDLSIAEVFYSVMGPEAQHAETAAGLASAGPHLRSTLGRRVRLKHVPELRFVEDSSVETGARIEAILRDLHANDEPAEEMGEQSNGGSE